VCQQPAIWLSLGPSSLQEIGVPDNSPAEKRALEPIEPSELLKRLRLSTGKAASFAGVSRRQLCYWTDTGIITPLEEEGTEAKQGGSALAGAGGRGPGLRRDENDDDDPSRRTYGFGSLHRVLLIDQALKQRPGLRRAAREVDQYLAARQRRSEQLASSIEQKREEFLTEQADRLEGLASAIREGLPKVADRARLLDVYNGLESLERLTARVLEGELLLEEDANACLRLASLVEQAEARMEQVALGSETS